MADIKISDLTAASSANGSMQLEVNDGGTSKRVTADQIKAFVIPDNSITSTKLTTTGVTAATYGSGSTIPVVTVDAAGRITAASTASVQGGQYFGSAATKAIAYNADTISENVTVTAGNNGLSAGPITVSSGFTVTVQSGSRWVIV